jgi:hypothetical protein
MLMKPIIYRDPNSTAGGSAAPVNGGSPAPAPSAASPAPAAATEGAKSPFESFREGLAKSLAKGSQSSQPPGDGKETPPTAIGGEGEDANQDPNSEEPGTTAEPDGETTTGEEQEGAEKDGWTEEEQAELKAHALDKLQHSAEGRALLKSFREARAEKDRVAGSNSNLTTRLGQMEAALHAGDAKALQALGYDLKLDQRTPDQIVGEIEEQFNGIKDAFAPLIEELKAENPEIARAVTRAAQKVLKGLNDKASIIEREKEKSAWQQEVLEKAGVKPDTKNAYKKLADSAEKHLTALTQQDPDAGKYYKLLEKETAPGGALHAMGITLARGYGLSPQTAKMMHEIGKGLFFHQNMKPILEGERRKWAKDRERSAITGNPGGAHPNPPAGGGPDRTSHLRNGMRAMMGKTN